MKKIAFYLAICLMAFAGTVKAWDTSRANAKELASLPTYCSEQKYLAPIALAGSGRQLSQEQIYATHKSWVDQYGDIFEHFHHYCWGLNMMNRYYRNITNRDGVFYLRSASEEFSYVIKRIPKSNTAPVHQAMIFYQRGKSYLLLNKYSLAIEDFEKSLHLDSKHADTYVGLYDAYQAVNKGPAAVEIIKKAIENGSVNRALKRRAAANNIPIKEEPTVEQTGPDQIATPPDSTTSTPSTPPPKEEIQSPQGSSSPAKTEGNPNPYCRFCP